MGNQLKKKEKSNKKETPESKEEKDLKAKYPDAIYLKDEKSTNKIKLELLNKQYHSKDNDPIEDILVHPNFTDSIIIATRTGKIKLYSDITKMQQPYNGNETILYDAKERIYSMILLKKNNNNICISLAYKILVLSFNKKKSLEKEYEFYDDNPQIKTPSLLELENGNIISAGGYITYWVKNNQDYNKATNAIQDDIQSRFINLVEFPDLKTIIITQQDTHLIYFLKYTNANIQLIKKIEKHSSIWYKGSAQRISSNYMIMVGKFELNAIDGTNGEIANRYPGIDKGALLNLTQSDSEDNVWLLTDFLGNYIEFYTQEGSDLVFLDKVMLEDYMKISWANQLVRINKECFVAINHNGGIFAFKMNFTENTPN